MPRTRDMVIFVAALLFLLVSIAVTYVQSTLQNQAKLSFDFFDASLQTATLYSATNPTTEVDRQSAILHFRSRIEKDRDGLLAIQKDVETVPQEVVEVSTQPQTGIVANYCGPDDSLHVLQEYPLRDTSVTVTSGMRYVVHTSVLQPVPTSGTTSSSTLKQDTQYIKRNLISMPVYPPIQSEVSCIPSAVVGVTANGSLLLNQDASSYFGASEKELIGFARDGFPIYGPYKGEVDTCGGYLHPEGYRYTLAKDRDFVLGCFVGSPRPFTL